MGIAEDVSRLSGAYDIAIGVPALGPEEQRAEEVARRLLREPSVCSVVKVTLGPGAKLYDANFSIIATAPPDSAYVSTFTVPVEIRKPFHADGYAEVIYEDGSYSWWNKYDRA